MSDGQNERQGGEPKVRRLSDAMRKVRIAEAERTDALSDLYDADRARLDLMADELAGVFADIPKDDEFFICAVGGSVPPRLWIDGTTHLVIGRDRRTYRFVKDTRLGRIVLGESADVDRMADLVTDYVAERIVERERAKDSDLLMSQLKAAVLSPRPGATPAESAPSPVPSAAAGLSAAGNRLPPSAAFRQLKADERRGTSEQGRSSVIWLLVMFLFGIAAGVLALLAYVGLNGPAAP